MASRMSALPTGAPDVPCRGEASCVPGLSGSAEETDRSGRGYRQRLTWCDGDRHCLVDGGMPSLLLKGVAQEAHRKTRTASQVPPGWRMIGRSRRRRIDRHGWGREFTGRVRPQGWLAQDALGNSGTIARMALFRDDARRMRHVTHGRFRDDRGCSARMAEVVRDVRISLQDPALRGFLFCACETALWTQPRTSWRPGIPSSSERSRFTMPCWRCASR